MNFFRKTLLAMTLFIWGVFAYAADASKTPSGTVTVNLKVVVLTYGQQAESSGGVLTFRGKQYPFNVSGLTIGANNIGASHLVAKGEVVVVNEKFGIRLTDIISPIERIETLK